MEGWRDDDGVCVCVEEALLGVVWCGDGCAWGKGESR